MNCPAPLMDHYAPLMDTRLSWTVYATHRLFCATHGLYQLLYPNAPNQNKLSVRSFLQRPLQITHISIIRKSHNVACEKHCPGPKHFKNSISMYIVERNVNDNKISFSLPSVDNNLLTECKLSLGHTIQ